MKCRIIVLLSVLSTLIVTASSAQIVFNESDILSLIPGTISGESFTVGDTQNAGIQALLDIDGPNRTWDFTTLTWPAPTAITQEFLALPNGALPGENDSRVAAATYAIRIADGSGKSAVDETIAYFSTSPTEHNAYGLFGTTGGETLDLLYDIPLLANPFPMTYLTAWQDQTTWTQSAQGITINLAQADDASVSGWGTLVLPTGSFQVLRLNNEKTLTSTFGGVPISTVVTTVVSFITKDRSVFASISSSPNPVPQGAPFLGAGYGAPGQGGGTPPADAPGNQQPPDGTQFVDTAMLGWDAVAGATTYDLQVDTGPLGKVGSTIVIDEVGLVATNYAPAGLDAGATYHWHVRGVNSDGPGPWTTSVSFTTAGPPPVLPGAVTLVSPADTATEVEPMPTLMWNAATDATTHDVQVATDAGFTALHTDLTGVAGTQTTVGPLANSTTYYWRVRGVNGQGNGDWSAGWMFTIEAAIAPELPGVVTLTSPTNGANDVEGMPSLAWNAATVADTYDVQVATDAGFTALHTDLTGVAATQTGVGPLTGMTTYYWRVRGVNLQGSGVWSAGWMFITAENVAIERIEGGVPVSFELYQNYPNPFNPSTTIQFDVPEASAVRLSVYDALGREVAVLADRQFGPGRYQFSWDATGVESGLYIYRLRAGAVQKTGTMILLK